MMMKNTFRKQFETNQLTHNNIVQIFKTRLNESGLIDEENEMKNDHLNKKQFQDNNGMIQTSNKRDKAQSGQKKNEEMQQNNQKFPNNLRENDVFHKDYLDSNLLSPVADAYEGHIQSGQDLKDSFNNDNKTFSFMKKNEDDGTIVGEQYKSDPHFFDLSSNQNLRTKKNSEKNQNVAKSQMSSQSSNKDDLDNQINSIRQCSSMEDGGGFGKLEKNKVTTTTGNIEGMQQSSDSKPSLNNQLNQNSTLNKSRAINEVSKKRIMIDSVNQRKKSHGLSMIRNKKEEKRQSEVDKIAIGIKKPTTNFLGVILKMKNYAYKMASTVESKRISILRRQKFEYLRDKCVVFGNWERNYNEINDYNLLKNFVYLVLQKILASNFIKKLNEIVPTLPLFLPQSYWKFFWDILNMIVVIFFFFFIPLHFIYNISFSSIFYFTTLDLSLTVIATLDIFVNLNTAYFSKGNITRKRTLIFLEYFSRDGLISLFFVMNIWIIVISERMSISEPLSHKFGIISTIIVLLKVLSQNTLQSKINDRFYLKKMQRGIIRLMQIFFNLFIVSHLFASTWLVVGKYNTSDGNGRNCNNNNTQTSSQQESCYDSWLDRLNQYQDLAFYEEYLRAYYFTTVTMITVGYGDIVPTNSKEYLLSILTMLIACGMFGYSLNSIGQILAEMNTDQKAYNEHFYAINGYMHKKNIPIDLQFQVREYLQYFFVRSNQEDLQKQQKVIRLLPETLQDSVIFESNKIILNISPIFRMNFSEQVLQKTIKIVEQKKYRPGELIIKQGIEDDCCIYFIEKGSVEIYNQTSNEELKILNKGQAFGEISFFTGMLRQSSIRSLEFTTLLAVKRSDFFEIVKNSSLDLEKFCMIKDSILFNSRYEGVGLYCYCCKSTTHIVSQCNFVHLQLDKFKKREKDVQRRNISQDALVNRTEVEDYALLCFEENIEQLQQFEWFNDIINKEFQNNLIIRNNSTKNIIQMRTTSINDFSQKNQTPKGNSNDNKYIQNNPNGLANIKIQFPYGKSISGNIRERELEYYDTHSNMISEYSSNQNLQKPTNNTFRRHSVKSEDGNQNTLNFYQSRKVQFSVTSLPGIDTEDHQQEKSLNILGYPHIHSPPQQFVSVIQPHSSSSYYQQMSGDYNTPTSRLRNQSQSERVSSINVVSSNNHINFNQTAMNNQNYFSQTSGQTGSNQYPNNSNSINIVSLNTQMNTNMNTQMNSNQISNQQPNILLKGFLTQQVSNQSIQDYAQQQAQQVQVNTPTHYRNNAPSFSQNVSIVSPLRQKDSSQIVQRGSKKRITLKTDFIRKRQPTNTIITKQISALGGGESKQNKQSDALIKQLQEIMQIPNMHFVKDKSPFENLKNFTIYMPHNNHDRVILSYILFMRKKMSTASKKKRQSSQKNQESSFMRNGTHASSKKNNYSIKQYVEMISDNQIGKEQQENIKEVNNSIKSLKKVL